MRKCETYSIYGECFRLKLGRFFFCVEEKATLVYFFIVKEKIDRPEVIVATLCSFQATQKIWSLRSLFSGHKVYEDSGHALKKRTRGAFL